jgi:hypothetical protein
MDDGPLHAWGFERRQVLDLEHGRISVAPPEYVILRKLQYYRDSGSDRHLRDIAMILRISPDRLELGEIGDWALRLDLDREWDAAQSYEPG